MYNLLQVYFESLREETIYNAQLSSYLKHSEHLMKAQL